MRFRRGARAGDRDRPGLEQPSEHPARGSPGLLLRLLLHCSSAASCRPHASNRRTVIALALAADTFSIVVMEIVDNAIVLAVPGAMDAGLGDALFWGSIAFALAVAWVAAFPVHRWLIARGRGHAVVHTHHGH